LVAFVPEYRAVGKIARRIKPLWVNYLCEADSPPVLRAPNGIVQDSRDT